MTTGETSMIDPLAPRRTDRPRPVPRGWAAGPPLPAVPARPLPGWAAALLIAVALLIGSIGAVIILGEPGLWLAGAALAWAMIRAKKWAMGDR
jgi:hypothetical protein